MKTGSLMIVAAVMSLSPVAYGQAAPTATAPGGATTSLVPSLGKSVSDGEIHYSLSASQSIQRNFLSGSGTYYTTSFSGNVGYTNRNERLPFSMVISSGILLTSQSNATVQTFQSASVSQSYVTPKWVFGVTDSVSYLPQSPSTGYSGIPGVGDIGTINGPATGPAGGILTNYGKRVSNSLGGNVERMLTASTSVSGTSDWSILRFIDGGGLETDSISGTVGLNHRLNGRMTVSGSANYSIFSYGTYGGTDTLGISGLSFQTRGISLSFTRLLTHSLSIYASGGPQLISSSNKTFIPSTTTGAGSIGVSYVHRLTNVSLSYVRGASGGSGVQPGSISDSVSGSVSHPYGRDWSLSVMGAYTHSSGLITNTAFNQVLGISQSYNSVFGGVQANRRLSAHTTGFLSYTVTSQSSSGSSATTSPNVFTGIGNAFSIGVTWAPRSTTVGQLF